ELRGASPRKMNNPHSIGLSAGCLVDSQAVSGWLAQLVRAIQPITNFSDRYLLVHRRQELAVALGLFQAVKYKFHLLDWRERIEHAAQDPDAVEVFFRDQQLF